MPLIKPVKGSKKLKRQLKRLGPEMQKQMGDEIAKLGRLVATAARKKVRRGSKTGKVYQGYKPRRTHQASAPGESPASDTGTLARNIITRVNRLELEAEVIARSPYAIPLEFGTRNMAARPFMGPALEENRDEIVERQRQAANAALKAIGKKR